MFIRYQCSTCRRTIDQLLDDSHVQPNLCIITKGCLGTLQPIAKVKRPETTAPVAGLTDWYPRGQVRGAVGTPTAPASVSLSNSDTGTVTVAFRTRTYNELAAASEALNLVFEQRVQSTIPFQQYEYRAAEGQVEFQGRDLSGRVLRFDQLAIDEGRVLVRVNGVERVDVTLAVNTVTFDAPLSSGDAVSMLVYAAQQVTRRTVPVTRHDGRAAVGNPGAWSNIRFIKRFDPAEGYVDRWYVFSTTLPLMAHIPADGSLRLVGAYTIETGTEVIPLDQLDSMLFLLSNYPWKNVDRYYNFSVPGSAVSTDFNLRCATPGGVRQLSVSEEHCREEYPELYLELNLNGEPGLSYISADALDTTVSSQVLADGSTSRRAASRVLGPV